MKKRSLLILMLVACAVLCVACAGGTATAKEITEVPVILNQAEYVLYQQIYFNDTGMDYVGKTVNKEGVFTTLTDAFNGKTRYYVWGYLDNTKCCDWQWEFVPKDPSTLPSNGSHVKVSGTFQASKDSLDGYWITGAEVTTVATYSGEQVDINMLTMDDTLERVQTSNIINNAETFEGKTFVVYARIFGDGVLQDPYYDGSWQAPFTTAETMPAIGTTVVLKGMVKDGVLADCTLLQALN